MRSSARYTSCASPTVPPRLIASEGRLENFCSLAVNVVAVRVLLGTSENAVKTQIWFAVCTYVLIAIIEKRLHLPHSLYEILQILSLTMFETTPINQLLTQLPADSDASSEPQQLVLL
jgi:hypothetical protein